MSGVEDDREAEVVAAVAGIPEGWCGGSQPLLLYRLSRNLAGLGAIVEVGTFAGKSTTALALGQRGAGGRAVVTVDEVEHAAVAGHLERAGLSGWVRRIVGTSRDVAAGWTTPIELLFIDAGHKYPDIRHDIDAWTPFVVTGGLVAIHDYPGWAPIAARPLGPYQIHRAVHETLMADPQRWQVVSDREHGSLIVFRRVDRPPRTL